MCVSAVVEGSGGGGGAKYGTHPPQSLGEPEDPGLSHPPKLGGRGGGAVGQPTPPHPPKQHTTHEKGGGGALVQCSAPGSCIGGTESAVDSELRLAMNAISAHSQAALV